MKNGKHYDFKKTLKQWRAFSDIPITEDDEIDKPFLHFEIGTNRFDIWHWFERTYDVSIYDDLMGTKTENRR